MQRRENREVVRKIGGLVVVLVAMGCGDDTASTGGNSGNGGGGSNGGSANVGGTGGAGPTCAPQYSTTPVDCPEGCIPIGPPTTTYCTSACTSSEDCTGTQECAQSATEPSVCLPPCDVGCDPNAYCDATTFYPGYCIPIGYGQ